MTNPLDSAIFAPLFSDTEITALLTDDAYVRALLEVEAALARAQAKVGVIPSVAAERISKVQAEAIDIGALTKGTIRSGFPIIALVEQLRKQSGAEAAPYVHWGATTQDIMDTAGVLQIRAAIQIFKRAIFELLRHLSELGERHRATVLAGRTHGQQALPITFGLKIAGWTAPMIRHAQRDRRNIAAVAGCPMRRRRRHLGRFGRQRFSRHRSIGRRAQLRRTGNAVACPA